MESEIPECTVEQLLNILSEKRNYLLHAYIKPLDEVYTNLYIGDELVNFYEIVHNLTVFNLNLVFVLVYQSSSRLAHKYLCDLKLLPQLDQLETYVPRARTPITKSRAFAFIDSPSMEPSFSHDLPIA